MDYRAYILDENGRICGVRVLDRGNDEEARLKAAQMLDGHDLEVWHRTQRIAVLRHQKSSGSGNARS